MRIKNATPCGVTPWMYERPAAVLPWWTLLFIILI